MSVYKKLHQVQAATRSLAPNAEGQTGAARYNYVAGAKLLAVVRPLMDSLGLLLSQEIVDITNQPITYDTKSGKKTEMFTTLHIRFTWIDSEDGSTMVNEFYANGMNAWDKGLGSALTYAERYYLMKTFHIATDEDDIDSLIKEEAVAMQAPSAPAYQPLSEERYWANVNAHASGQKTPKGGSIRDAWIKKTHADREAIAKFDHDVENVQLANNPDF